MFKNVKKCKNFIRYSFLLLSPAALLNHLAPQVGDGGSEGVDFNEEHNTAQHTGKSVLHSYTAVPKALPCL